jgi:hypothetical protein
VGGLIGSSSTWVVGVSSWDIMTSGQSTSAGGPNVIGLPTEEMRTETAFLEAGWDLAGESDNGVNDLWWILDGQDYPRLWWEPLPEGALEEESPEPQY